MNALKTKSVPALERALSILEVLAESRGGLSLSQLTARLGLPKSSTHCILLTLERRGYLRRHEGTGRYMFGFEVFGLANMALNGMELREEARPYLETLRDNTGLTVHMGILERNEAVLIEKIEPSGPLKLATWIGKRMPLHCTGVGQALVAYLPEGEIDQWIRQGLLRYNENTIVSSRKFKEKLALVRKLGHSYDDEEETIGLRCLGAPIRNLTGKVIAAISVAGTVAQINLQNLPALVSQVKQTAASISQRLGYAPEGRREPESEKVPVESE